MKKSSAGMVAKDDCCSFGKIQQVTSKVGVTCTL
jgi:hypothetical protein